MPGRSSSSRSSSPSRLSSRPSFSSSSSFSSRPRPSSPSNKPNPTPTPTQVNVSPSVGIMDGVKWGFGTSIGHSIGNLFGFGTQHVHHDNVPTSSPTPAPPSLPPPPKDAFTQCLETMPTEKKMEYCHAYTQCMQNNAQYTYKDYKDHCRQEAFQSIQMQ